MSEARSQEANMHYFPEEEEEGELRGPVRTERNENINDVDPVFT